MGWLGVHKRQKSHKFVLHLKRATFSGSSKFNWLNYGAQSLHNISLQSKFWLTGLAENRLKQFRQVESKPFISGTGEPLLFQLCILRYSPKFPQNKELHTLLVVLVGNKDMHVSLVLGLQFQATQYKAGDIDSSRFYIMLYFRRGYIIFFFFLIKCCLLPFEGCSLFCTSNKMPNWKLQNQLHTTTGKGDSRQSLRIRAVRTVSLWWAPFHLLVL